MDPLSVSASVAGLITLTELIVSRGYEFVKGVKNAKAEIGQLLAEITALFGVLQSLRLVALRFEGNHFNAALQLHHLQTCRELVNRIRMHLKLALPEDSDGRWRAAGKSLRWPLSSAETKSLIADVGRHKTTLSLALNADGMNALLDILSQEQALRKGQDGIQDSIAHLQEQLDTRRIRDEIAASRMYHGQYRKRYKLLKEWTAVDPEMQHNAAVRLRHRGTGKWFLEGEDFQSCIEGRTSALWLYGFAGAGKTVLSSTVIETIKSKLVGQTSEGLAYFYCDYKDSATQQATNIMRSLVKHAAVQNERSCRDLQQFLERHKQHGTLDSAPSLSNLTGLLVKMISHYDCFYIVVDAIDECPDDHRHEVLGILRDLSTDAVNARLIYTSREEIDIKKAFTEFKRVRIAANISDLELYVESEIGVRVSSGRLIITHSEVKDKIIDTLVHGADGMFRWAACQLDYLCELTNDSARLRALKELPPDLFATYERILERIVARSDNVQKIVERTLRWTLGAVRTLTIPELIEAIAIDEDENSLNEYSKVEEVSILRWCSCLVRKTANTESIELAHFTVEEFLKAINPYKTPRLARFAHLKQTADLVLGRTCLHYLNYDDFANAKVEDRFWCSRNPFWNYAALKWRHHTAKKWDDETVGDLMRRFFHCSISPQFVIWNRFIWLHSHGILNQVESENSEEISQSWKQSQFQQVDSVSPLHHAASLALGDLTRWLISQGSDPNKPSSMGFPLECALSSGKSEGNAVLMVVSILLQSGADANMMSGEYDDKTPLALAIQSEEPSLIKAMLDAGATVDMSCVEMLQNRMYRKRTSGKALPAFLESVSYTDLPLSVKPALMDLTLNVRSTTEKALNILEQSSINFPENAELMDITLQDAASKGQLNVVSRTIPFLINSIDSRNGREGRTALHYACMNGHYNIVRVLLDKGAGVNVQDKDGDTPAHLSIKENVDNRVLEALIEQGAKISIVNAEQENLLHVAAQSSRPDILAFLLIKDPTCENRNKRTADGKSLLLCALASTLKSLQMIELAGSAIPISECLASNKNGETGLHLATKDDNLERMTYFLDKGNLNEKTNEGSTALHLAFADGTLETAKLLLSRKADMFLATDDGQTPLHLAAFRSPNRLATLLSIQGIETIVNKKDDSGCGAIHIVIRQTFFSSNTLQMMKKLLENPAVDWNLIDGDNMTPLIRLAIDMGTKVQYQREIHEAIELLLNKDVDLDKRDNDGSTALHRLCDTEITPLVASTIELLLEKGIDVRVRNKEGLLAVEILLLRIELSNKQTQGLSDHETQILRSLLRRVSDEHFNLLSRGRTRPLVLALQFRVNDVVEELTQRTTDVDVSYAESTYTFSPLEASCAYPCNFKIFEILASRSKDLSGRNAAGNTLLHLACSYNRGDVLEYLLARKVEVEIEDSTGSTPLCLSMRYGRPEMMEALLEAGADPSHLDQGGLNVWHAAAFSPSTDILDKLFRKSKTIELEARTSFGYTPLLCAVGSGRRDNVEKLLAQKAELSARDDLANGVLHWASTLGNPVILKFLIQEGPSLDVNASNSKGESPLLIATAKGHHASVAMLLDAGGDPHVKDESGQTLLHHLASSGRQDILTLLQSEDILTLLQSKDITLDLEAGNILGRTPLLCAVENGHVLMAKSLIDQGANIHAVGTDGWSILHLAAYFGKASVIAMLLAPERTPDRPTERDKDQRPQIDVNARHPADGDTPLGVAARQGHLAAIETLLDNGADVLKTNSEGWNVVHIAAVNQKRTVLQAVFDHCDLKRVGLDVDARDRKGRTALMLVKERGAGGAFGEFADVLLRRGARRYEPVANEARVREERERWGGSGGFCNVDLF